MSKARTRRKRIMRALNVQRYLCAKGIAPCPDQVDHGRCEHRDG